MATLLFSCLLAGAGQAPSAYGAQDEADQRKIQTLIERLDSDALEERETAAKSLQSMGEAVRPLLEKAARGRNAEIAARARAILAAVASASAERFLAGMEKKILESKSFRMEFSSTRKWNAFANPLSGSVVFEPGRKAALRAKGTYVSEFDYKFVCDGKLERQVLASNINTWNRASKDLNRKLARSVVRAGIGIQIWLSLVGGDLRGPAWGQSGSFEPIRTGVITPGGKEQLDGKEVRTYGYPMTVHARGREAVVRFEVTLWVDAESQLPVKRVSRCVGGAFNDSRFTVVETYRNHRFDAEIEPSMYADTK